MTPSRSGGDRGTLAFDKPKGVYRHRADCGCPACEPIETRLWGKVEKTDTCWLWIGRTNAHGYGVLAYKGRTWLAHRLVLALSEVPISSMVVCHSCDVPNCVNPAHLFVGTQADNMRDCSEKGRIRTPRLSQTHCHRGHEFTPENTYVYFNKLGANCRLCKKCQRHNERLRRAK